MNTIAMKPIHRQMPLILAALLLLVSAAMPPLSGAATPALARTATTSELLTAATGQAPVQNGIDKALGAGRSAQQAAEPDFLPPDEAFKFSAFPDGADKIKLIWGVTNGYYLYRARIKVTTDGGTAQVGELALPTGETKIDDYFGKQEVYHHDIVGSLPVSRSGGSAIQVPLKVTYQGCATAGLCYPPITKTVNVTLPPAGAAGSAAGDTSASAAPATAGATTTPYVSEQTWLFTLLSEGNLLLVLGTFFAIGVGLSVTPCVLPMIPILSGIIVGQGEKVTVGRGFSLAFTYVQGMAVTYAAAGAIFVLVFKQAPQAFFQQPWIIALFVTLFVALALSMFGFYTLQMPSAIQTRLTSVSNQQKSGSYVGTFVMGALSALVVTACVAPALIAALSVISQTGKIARGAAALYATGLGMGVPLLIVGASAGSLLPRVGPWMDTVKQLFGVLFIALAIYFLQPLISASFTMLLWSALAVITGFWIFALKARDGGPAPAAIRAFGLLALVYGIILLIGVAAGGNDPLQPLNTLRASNSGGAGTNVAAQQIALPFETIKSLDDLNKKVAAASAAGRPVMLDFYADWCTSCKEMERYTFSDKNVQAALSNAVLLHADVTKNDAIDQELLKHFGIFGPPTIAFYGPDGEERQSYRVVGYMKADEFATLAHRAFNANLSASSAPVPGST
jgi:thioredoxin:protein disulfide reductase